MLVSATAAWAGEKPVYAPAPKWVKPAPPIDSTKLTDASPILLRSDQQQRLEKGEVWSYTDTAIRIASNQVLTQVGTLTLPWKPDSGDLIIHKVEILRDGKHINVLDNGSKFTVLRREQQLERYELTGILTATMPVQGLRVGDVLHVVASITVKDPALKGNVQTAVPLISKPVRVGFARAILSWPKGEAIHWKLQDKDQHPQVVDDNGYSTVQVQLPLDKAPELPDDVPQRYQRLPILEAGSFADWQSVSKVMAPLYKTDGLIAPDGPIAAEVAAIEKKTTDQKVRAAMALRVVQDNIRYLFNGMAGGNYVPQTPADTWKLRYGDCKAKTLLLLAMLRDMGIEAEPVMASSKLGGTLVERLPDPLAFDHVLVRATIDGQSLWLDGTRTGDRLADIMDTPDFHEVLPIRPDGAKLMPIPMRVPGRPSVKVAMTLDETAGINLPSLYTMDMTLHGSIAEMLTTAWNQADADHKDKMVGSLIDSYLGTNYRTGSALTPNDDAGTVTLHVTGIADPDWNKSDDRYRTTLDQAVSSISFSPDRTRVAWRDIPVALGDPDGRVVETKVILPDGGKGFTLDGDTTLPAQLAGYTLNRQTSLKDGVLTVTDSAFTKGGEIPAADIADTRSKVALAKTRLLRGVAPADYPALWKQVMADKSGHRLEPLRAAFTKRIAQADSDDKANRYTERAQFFIRVYDWQDALTDINKVIELSPDADNYQWRSRLLANMGERQKALADLLKAQQLNPGSASIESELVALYSDLNQPDKALEIADQRIALGGKDKRQFVMAKADVLARDGKVDDALSALDGEIKTNPGNPALLNERCWLKGTMKVELPSALKDCTKSIELADSPAAALDSRAMVYFRMGRMSDALADLNAAINIAPDHSASRYMRGVIRMQQGDAKAAKTDLEAARMIQPTIDTKYARWGIKP
ncbi:DUF3857 domain-containing protein [Stakelama sediminis]|nr:DUF3857 domain-containing protein [Stakelama sediminis]